MTDCQSVFYTKGVSSIWKGKSTAVRNVKIHDERKQELIDTAKRLFLEKGIEHTTISMLVGEIGVAHGLFYYYFKSKDEVVECVLDNMLNDLKIDLSMKLHESEKDFSNKLKILMKALYDIYYFKLDANRLEDWVRIYYRDKLSKFLIDIEQDIVQEGIQNGYIKVPNAELVLRIAVGGCLLVLEKEQITCEKLTAIVFQVLSLPYESRQ